MSVPVRSLNEVNKNSVYLKKQRIPRFPTTDTVVSKSVRVSEHGATGDVAISLWELLDANHQRVEGIGCR